MYLILIHNGLLCFYDMIQVIKNKEDDDPDYLGPFQYPSHPFSPGLCQILANVPQGFSKVSLTQTLSNRCINAIRAVARWDRKSRIVGRDTSLSESRARYNVAVCVRMLQSQLAFTQNERLTLLASTVYCMFLVGEFDSWFVLNCFVQLYCRTIQKTFADITGVDSALALWAAVLLKTVYAPGTFASQLADTLFKRLDGREVALILHGKDTERMDDFFWNPSLTLALRSLVSDPKLVTGQGRPCCD
jgi:hypothetical protein